MDLCCDEEAELKCVFQLLCVYLESYSSTEMLHLIEVGDNNMKRRIYSGLNIPKIIWCRDGGGRLHIYRMTESQRRQFVMKGQ